MKTKDHLTRFHPTWKLHYYSKLFLLAKPAFCKNANQLETANTEVSPSCVYLFKQIYLIFTQTNQNFHYNYTYYNIYIIIILLYLLHT